MMRCWRRFGVQSLHKWHSIDARVSCRRPAEAAAVNAAFAHTLTVTRASSGCLQGHPLGGKKRLCYFDRRKRADGRRAEESLRPRSGIGELGLAYADR